MRKLSIKHLSWGKYKIAILFLVAILLLIGFFIANKKDTQEKVSSADKYFVDNNFEQSRDIFEAEYKKSTDTKTKAELAYKVSQSYLGMENYPEAKSWLNKSLEHYDSISNQDEGLKYSVMVVKNDIEYIKQIENLSTERKGSDTKNEETAL